MWNPFRKREQPKPAEPAEPKKTEKYDTLEMETLPAQKISQKRKTLRETTPVGKGTTQPEMPPVQGTVRQTQPELRPVMGRTTALDLAAVDQLRTTKPELKVIPKSPDKFRAPGKHVQVPIADIMHNIEFGPEEKSVQRAEKYPDIEAMLHRRSAEDSVEEASDFSDIPSDIPLLEPLEVPNEVTRMIPKSSIEDADADMKTADNLAYPDDAVTKPLPISEIRAKLEEKKNLPPSRPRRDASASLPPVPVPSWWKNKDNPDHNGV